MITNNNQQTAEANLRLAADAMERTGWTVARLIAASVERGKPGRPAGNAPDKCISGKVSIRAGAELLRKGQDTIRGYLAAWDRAAADGLCKPAADMVPEEGLTADLPDAAWSEYYITTNFPNVGSDTHGEDDAPAMPPWVAPVRQEQTPGATLNEWASSEGQMKGILNSPTGAGEAARRFVREAIKSDPNTQREARKALDEVYGEAPKPYPGKPEPSILDEAQDLVHEFRKLHKGIDSIVRLVNDGVARVADRDAALAEIRWLRTALSYIEDGIKSDNLSDEIADFLAEVSE